MRLPFRDAKEEILVGLNARDLAANLMSGQHGNFDSLLQDLLAINRIKNCKPEDTFRDERTEEDRLGASAKTAVNGAGGIENRARQAGADRHEGAVKAKTAATMMGDKELKCFRCGLAGHISRECKHSEAVCFYCKREGHIAPQCPQRRNAPQNKQYFSKPRNVRILDVEKDTGDKFVHDVVLNGRHALKGFIDTGSAVCTIKESAVLALKLTIERDVQPLYGYGGNTMATVFSIGNITSSIATNGVVEENVQLLVVPSNAQETDLLIGRTYTELKHIAYVRKDDKLVFGYADDQPFCDINVDELVQNEQYKSVEAVTIRGKSAANLKVHARKQNVILRVFNTNAEEVIIPENKSIGKVSDSEEKATYVCKYERKSIKEEMVNFDDNVKREEREELVALLNEYRNCIALTLEEIGCTKVVEMDIVDNDIPVRCQPYKTSEADRKTIDRLVNELKSCGIVAETNRLYSSPVLIVKLKNGEPRLVVDYRKLNQQTVKINYPVPGIDEQFQYLVGGKIFATLDLANGYMQVPLTEKARQKTAFITADTTGEFTRMVFGLTNAPYEFVRMMNLVLGPLRNEICCCYLDGVILPAEDWQQLIERLRLIFECFKKANLTLNINKCEFGKDKVEYLGYEVTKQGLKPGKNKIKAVESFPMPKNVHEVRRFLGLTGFFRRFVKNYAQIAKPMSDLTRKDSEFKLSEKVVDAFDQLKSILVKAPVLELYDAKVPTELHTDASAVGLAGMLLQRDENNKLQLVCIEKDYRGGE